VSEADRNRLVACRVCGNRVVRDVRRCPACGTREPTTAPAESPAPGPAPTTMEGPAEAAAPRPATDAGLTPPAARGPDAKPEPPPAGEPAVFTPPTPAKGGGGQTPPRQAARRRRRSLVLTLVALFALAAAGVTAVYVTAPSVSPTAPRPAEPMGAPSVAPAAPRDAGPAAPSRSRGRSDWVFFFKPGDWLTRMTDEALLGVVVRVEKTHGFADGSSGPAYVVQSMEGEERVVDADELERSARLR